MAYDNGIAFAALTREPGGRDIYVNVLDREGNVELLENGMAQIYEGNSDNKFSFPVTAGEAGIYRDGSGGYYCYGTYAQNAPAECGIEGCRNSVCECGSAFCHFHTHDDVWQGKKFTMPIPPAVVNDDDSD